MKKFLLFFGLIMVVFVGAALASVVGELGQPAFDPVAYARAEAEIASLERRAQIADALGPLDLALAAAWRLLPLGVALGLLALTGAWGVAALARFRRERRPDDRGLLPVELAELPQVGAAALGAFHTARIAEAGRQSVPHSLNFSPHYHRADSAGALTAPALQLPTAPESSDLLTFAQLLDAGRVGRGNPLLLGYDLDNDGAELLGSWADLYSTATAGLPGTGKTTSQRFFACQTALHGARFVVCDPHLEAGDDSLAATLAPLRSIFLTEPAERPAHILDAARYVWGIGDARVRGKSDDRTPVILWVDELTSLLGRSDVGDDLAETLEAIAQEHRKVSCFLAASGQIWTAARTSSELRDSLASVLCHRMKRNQARLLLPTDEAVLVERLATGEAILWRTSGVTSRVRIPNTTAADVRRVGAILEGEPATESASPGRPIGFRPTSARRGAEAATEAATEAGAASPLRPHQDGQNGWSVEEARIVALLAQGKGPKEIIWELYQVKGGDAYTIAAQKVRAVLERLAVLAQRAGGAR